MLLWTLQNDPDRTLVQFIGDESLSVDLPHGNSKPTEKRPAKPYVRTAASVLRDVEGAAATPEENSLGKSWLGRQSQANLTHVLQ